MLLFLLMALLLKFVRVGFYTNATLQQHSIVLLRNVSCSVRNQELFGFFIFRIALIILVTRTFDSLNFDPRFHLLLKFRLLASAGIKRNGVCISFKILSGRISSKRIIMII